MATKIFSFGYRHGTPGSIEGARVIDVRKRFNRNPFHNRALRQLRGDSPLVAADILKTPHFDRHYNELKEYVRQFEGVVYLGCTGGHHRSVYLAVRLSKELGIPCEHLNYNDK